MKDKEKILAKHTSDKQLVARMYKELSQLKKDKIANQKKKKRAGFAGGSVVKNPPAAVGNIGQSLGQRDPPGQRNSNPLQYSCLGNPMDRGAWLATVYWITKGQTRLSH